MNLSAKQKQRHRRREYGYQGGRKGGMDWEIGIDYIYTTIYKIDNQ